MRERAELSSAPGAQAALHLELSSEIVIIMKYARRGGSKHSTQNRKMKVYHRFPVPIAMMYIIKCVPYIGMAGIALLMQILMPPAGQNEIPRAHFEAYLTKRAIISVVEFLPSWRSSLR